MEAAGCGISKAQDRDEGERRLGAKKVGLGGRCWLGWAGLGRTG